MTVDRAVLTEPQISEKPTELPARSGTLHRCARGTAKLAGINGDVWVALARCNPNIRLAADNNGASAARCKHCYAARGAAQPGGTER